MGTFQTQQGRDTYQLTYTGIPYIRPIQGQARQNTSMAWGGAPEAPPLTEKLLAIHGWWRFLQVYSSLWTSELVVHAPVIGTDDYVHAGSTNQTLRGIGRWMWPNYISCITFSKYNFVKNKVLCSWFCLGTGDWTQGPMHMSKHAISRDFFFYQNHF